MMAPRSLVLATSSIQKSIATRIMSNRTINGAYEISYGTSFSAPHVAGVAVLLKSAHPEWSATTIKSAIMTIANILDNTPRLIQEYNYNILSQMASPMAMGAGHIDPNKAVDPGLVYDATPQDYVNLICSVRSNKRKIKEITRSKNYSCSNPSFDLNYPLFYISYTYRRIMKQKPVNFQRTITNVGEGATTYNVIVTTLRGFDVTIMPETLVFGRKYENKTYTITLSSIGIPNSSSFGQLTWAEENGKHLVRSLIVVYIKGFFE